MAGTKKLLDLAKGIIAYHGSPHKFDRFDISKIGTGEGAQAYGHGLYFADNEDVARSYRDNLSRHNIVLSPEVGALPLDAQVDIDRALKAGGSGLNDVLAGLSPEHRALADAALARNGSMYQVRINADPEHFLDWDKPLSKQPERVRSTLEKLIGAPAGTNRVLDDRFLAAPSKAGGYEYKADVGRIAKELGTSDTRKFSETLNEAGIPGIKYLDQGSRGDGEGSRNYVVFDDKPVEILRRYAGGGRALADLVKEVIGREPQKTVSAYKLFRQKGDDLYPLFVNANKPVPMGQWLDAESGPLVGGKVKSSLGPLAYRPGWHAGDLPIATHIGGKSQPGLKAPDYRPDNQVWAEVSMPDDIDWQSEALARAQLNKAGQIIPRTAHITDQIPFGGHYRYKTNPNMTGNWLIGGSMKVNRILPDAEVRDINEGSGVADLPRLMEILQRQGRARGGSLIQDQYPTRYLPHVGRQVMADGGAAPNMSDLMSTVNSVFSRSRPAATRESLTGVSSSPYVTGPGAYTDAGGQKIEPAFVTGMKDGYPVPPMPPAAAPKPAFDPMSLAGLGKNRNAILRSMGVPGYAGGGGRFAEMAADIVAKAVEKARNVSPGNRLGVYHNLDAGRINDLVNRFNGIPGPSLAISKPNASPFDFGSATLVGRPHLAIPSEDTHVFGSDAYTPRMPRIFSAADWDRPQDFIFKGPGAGFSSRENEVPATAENIIAHMRQLPILGGEGDASKGIGLLKAHVTPRPKTLSDVQSRRHYLADDYDEDDPRWSSVRGRVNSSGGLFSPYAREKVLYPQDQIIQGAIDYHHEGFPGLYKTYREDLPSGNIAVIEDIIHDTKQLQPSYMESKPMRNVGFDEFGAAVLPDDGLGSVARGALVRAGMPEQSIMHYKKPSERVGILRELAKDYGFADGGSVEQAMDMVRRQRHADGGVEPGDRAHEFIVDQLYGDKIRDLSRPSPLLEQYSDRMTDMAMRENADRPMPTAHEFVQHQMNKREPQLPQRDREAEAQMRDAAKEAIHLGAYATPAAPLAAAYDVYEGLRSGNPVDMAMAALGARGKAAKAALAATGVMMPTEAEAKTPLGEAMNLARKYGRSTVAHPYRKAFPGIYGDPREIVAEAESRVAPESPALKQLFGVTRQDLYDIGANRAGNMEPQIAMKAGARGTPSAENLMVPRNERRLMDVLSEAGNMPGLRTGMDPWYVMDPLYERMEKLLGPEEAKRRYDILNHSIGTMSPGSPVTTEVNRGLAAYYLHNRGRYKDFLDYGGNPASATVIPRGRSMSFAEEFPDLLGHAYHSTSQAPILGKYLETGEHGMQSPKVPLYIQSSGVPQTGFQTKLPVPDAHFTRAVGMADTRRGANDYGVSMKMPEYQQVGPWFREKVAAPIGMQAVPAQARLWGAMSGQTGVDTAIGSPKLEMIANEIMRIANKYGISPDRARDMVLQGELFNRGGSVVKLAHDVISRRRDAA